VAQPEDPTLAMKLLVDHRTDLVTQRTQTVNRIHKLLRELTPGGAKTQLSTRQAAAAVKAIKPVTAMDKIRLRIARDLLCGLRQLDTRIATATAELEALVAQSGTTLTDIPGCGAIMAATLLGYTGDITRFPNRNHYASFNGTAPIDASSGENVRAPAQPPRQPPDQFRATRHSHLPDRTPSGRARLLRPQAQRRQDPRRSPPCAQEAPVRRGLPTPDIHHPQRKPQSRLVDTHRGYRLGG
jgi:hypothetical protein